MFSNAPDDENWCPECDKIEEVWKDFNEYSSDYGDVVKVRKVYCDTSFFIFDLCE